MQTIGFIGGGLSIRMMLQSFIHADLTFKKIKVYDTNEQVLQTLKNQFQSVEVTSDDLSGVAKSDILVLAAEPVMIEEKLAAIKAILNFESIVVSLVPKMTLETLSDLLDGFPNIVRWFPSAILAVNHGINPVCFSPAMTLEDKNRLQWTFAPLGLISEIDESKMEAYVVINSMGPAYLFLQLQKLQELAKRHGMDETESRQAIKEMLEGSIKAFSQNSLSYAEIVQLIEEKPFVEIEKPILEFSAEYLTETYNSMNPWAIKG